MLPGVKAANASIQMILIGLDTLRCLKEILRYFFKAVALRSSLHPFQPAWLIRCREINPMHLLEPHLAVIGKLVFGVAHLVIHSFTVYCSHLLWT